MKYAANYSALPGNFAGLETLRSQKPKARMRRIAGTAVALVLRRKYSRFTARIQV